MPPFPFIVGCGRSGTTLLQLMLDAHPEVAVPPETYFVITLARQRERYETAGGFDAEGLARDLLAHPWFRLWRPAPDEVREALMVDRPTEYPQAIRRLFALYASRRGKSRFADKTPAYVLKMPLLASLFPEARFVHLIRDGRDVALSLVEVPFGPNSRGSAAEYWRFHVERGQRQGPELGRDRYLEIRYEDLVEEPERALVDMCGFLDIEFDPAMLSYLGDPDRVREFQAPGYHGNLSRPPTKGLRDWRRDMRRRDVAVFEAIAGDLLGSLGYERAFDAPPLGARLAARAQNARARTRRAVLRYGRPLARSGPVRAVRRRVAAPSDAVGLPGERSA